jgi:hypothetical protein
MTESQVPERAGLTTQHTVTADQVLPGFWDCCQARQSYAVWFIREKTGERVWYGACTACTSSVGTNRRATIEATP